MTSSPIKAMTKEDVQLKIKQRVFPNFVIQAFNECIEESKIKHSNRVTQERVIEKIQELNKDITRSQIFAEHLLDVEDFYRDAGWHVTFYKPAYNDDFKAYFEFR